jgi:hypothetical protein
MPFKDSLIAATALTHDLVAALTTAKISRSRAESLIHSLLDRAES